MSDRKKVVALGFFDGVHLGHAALLNRAKEVAEKLDMLCCLHEDKSPWI